MSFEDIPEDREPSYPCHCGGNITPYEIHYVSGYFGDPPDPCCESWSCDKCGKVYYQHDGETRKLITIHE